MRRLVGMGKKLIARTQEYMFDTPVEIITTPRQEYDDNGDPITDYDDDIHWSGYGALHPNLPRYERNAVSQPVLGVEERRVVYYCYLPKEAPVHVPGMKIRSNGVTYELVKAPLPMGGKPNVTWRLDLGGPL